MQCHNAYSRFRVKFMYTRHLVPLILPAILLALHIATPCKGFQDEANTEQRDEEHEVVRALVEGYKQNREACDAFDCEFRVTFGAADSEEDAIAGNLKDLSPTRSAKWVVSGDVEFFRSDCDSPPSVKVVSSSTAMLNCASEAYCRDGMIAMYRTHGGVARLIGKDDDQNELGPSITPWNMAVMGANERADPHAVVSQALAENRATYAGARKERGYDVEVVSVRDDVYALNYEYCFSADVGFIPVVIREGDAHIEMWVLVDNVIRDERGSFFPSRVIRLTRKRNESQILQVCLIEVTALRSVGPNDEMPTIRLTAENILNHRGKNRRLVTERMVGPANIGELFDEIYSPLETRIVPPTQERIQRRWLASCVLVVVAAVLCAVILRRWRMRIRGAGGQDTQA